MKLIYFTIFILFSILMTTSAHAQAEPFIFEWTVDPSDLNLVIPRDQNHLSEYNYRIDFGDGTPELLNQTGDVNHIYQNPGTYEVKIYGAFANPNMGNSPGAHNKFTELKQWGDIEWKSWENAFSILNGTFFSATDVPNTSQVSSFEYAFAYSTLPYLELTHLDTSAAITLEGMFVSSHGFNPIVDLWNTSQVTNMSYLFGNATDANPNIENWDVTNVTTMGEMFYPTSGLSRLNYSQMLHSFSEQDVMQNVNLNAGDTPHCASVPRDDLITNKGWSIIDDGSNCVARDVSIYLPTGVDSIDANDPNLTVIVRNSSGIIPILDGIDVSFFIASAEVSNITWTCDNDGVSCGSGTDAIISYIPTLNGGSVVTYNVNFDFSGSSSNDHYILVTGNATIASENFPADNVIDRLITVNYAESVIFKNGFDE